MKKKILFLIHSSNQQTGQTQKDALSKVKVVIITVEFSLCAVDIGYKGSRNNVNLSGMKSELGNEF